MKKIRWGIVGPGNIAHKFAQAIARVEGAELAAVASRSEKSGQAFAEKYNIPHVFCGYEQMAASDAVDAVYIATPHPFHLPCALLYLNAKKHVLCEKPLCVNAAQATRLKECAEQNGVFLMEAMWTRFLPTIREVCSIVQSGAIGEVMGIRADFCYNLTPEQESKIYQNEMAGGSLLDVGVYCLHFAALFLGNHPEKIDALAKVEGGVDHHTNILLRYSNGAIANLSSAIALEKPGEGYIYGTKGHIYLPKFYRANEFYLCIGAEKTRIEKPSIGNGFEEEILEACACIRAGKTQSDILPLSETIDVLTLMDRVRDQIGLSYPMDQ